MNEGPLESIRQAEIEIVRPFFKPGMKVLEIGGGSGYQAQVIESWGCAILSVDLASRQVEPVRFHSVVSYDGTHLPAGSDRFDLVFSSNVLEHVENLDDFLSELFRVVKPGGVLIHILPSTSWRLWTSVMHYVFLMKYLAGVRNPIAGIEFSSVTERARRRGVLYLMRRVLAAGPHGAYSSALSELYYFSVRRWRRVFERKGFIVDRIESSGIYNSGYMLFPGLSIAVRKGLSKLLGSSTNVFILRKPA